MNIAGYMNKKKLLGANKSEIVKNYELFAHKSEMDLIEALDLEKEAIFRIKINEYEEVLLKDKIHEPLNRIVTVSIDEYTDNKGDIWFNDLVLRQNTLYNDFNLRIDLLNFGNGKKIAFRNYGNIIIYPIKAHNIGYGVSFRVWYCGYTRFVIMDKELNKYLCIDPVTPGYNKYSDCEELSFTYDYNYNCNGKHRLRIIEKIDKIRMEQIEEIEIIY